MINFFFHISLQTSLLRWKIPLAHFWQNCFIIHPIFYRHHIVHHWDPKNGCSYKTFQCNQNSNRTLKFNLMFQPVFACFKIANLIWRKPIFSCRFNIFSNSVAIFLLIKTQNTLKKNPTTTFDEHTHWNVSLWKKIPHKLPLLFKLYMWNCRSTPARHAANPYQKKSHPMLRRNSKHLLDFNYHFSMYFNCCAYIRIRIYTYS